MTVPGTLQITIAFGTLGLATINGVGNYGEGSARNSGLDDR